MFADKKAHVVNKSKSYMDNVMQSSKEIFETTDFLVGLTKKLLASEEDDYLWMEKLWEWADENNVSILGKKLFDPNEEKNLDIMSQNKQYLLTLTGLDLTEYKLDNIPIEIGKLVSLTSIGLGGNNFDELPREIGQLVNLEKLFLWNNQLKELPDEIVNLVNLKQLYLNDNPSLVLSKNQKEWIFKLEMNSCDVRVNEANTSDPSSQRISLLPDIDADDDRSLF